MKSLAEGTDKLGLVDWLETEILPKVQAGADGVSIATWESSLTNLAAEVLSRPGKNFRSRLVEVCFSLAALSKGTSREIDPRVPLLVELLHCGSLIIDDIQDDSLSRRGGPALHTLCGVPLALNTGNWLYFVALEMIEHIGLADRAALRVYRSLSTTMFRCHQGQALDLSIDAAELRQRDVSSLAAAVAALKTGWLFAFASDLGAICADADPVVQKAMSRFGSELGIALQQLDDYGGLVCPEREQKGLEDLACARITWPWAYVSENVDEVRFAGLQSKLRQARAARGGDRRALLVALRTELGGLVELRAKTAVSDRLATALIHLRAALDESEKTVALLDELAAEVARLEASFG